MSQILGCGHLVSDKAESKTETPIMAHPPFGSLTCGQYMRAPGLLVYFLLSKQKTLKIRRKGMLTYKSA